MMATPFNLPAPIQLTTNEIRFLEQMHDRLESMTQEDRLYKEQLCQRIMNAEYRAGMRTLRQMLRQNQAARTRMSEIEICEVVDFVAKRFKASEEYQELHAAPRKMLRHEEEIQKTLGYIEAAMERICPPSAPGEDALSRLFQESSKLRADMAESRKEKIELAETVMDELDRLEIQKRPQRLLAKKPLSFK